MEGRHPTHARYVGGLRESGGAGRGDLQGDLRWCLTEDWWEEQSYSDAPRCVPGRLRWAQVLHGLMGMGNRLPMHLLALYPVPGRNGGVGSLHPHDR